MMEELIVPVGLGMFLGVLPWRIALMLLGAVIAALSGLNYVYPGSELAAGWSMVFAVMLFMSPIIVSSYAVTFALRRFCLRRMAGTKERG